MENVIYNVDHFINKFRAIPEEMWCTTEFINGSGSKCANGHCGIRSIIDFNNESMALQKVFSPLMVTSMGVLINDYVNYSLKAAYINNGDTDQYQQPTPKQRILQALYDIKAMQDKPKEEQPRVIYKVVEVDSKVKALTKQEIILS